MYNFFVHPISKASACHGMFGLYWLNYWHIMISKGTSCLTSDTLMIPIQYCYLFKQFTECINVMRRMVILHNSLLISRYLNLIRGSKQSLLFKPFRMAFRPYHLNTFPVLYKMASQHWTVQSCFLNMTWKIGVLSIFVCPVMECPAFKFPQIL